jgi:hypothetical protein
LGVQNRFHRPKLSSFPPDLVAKWSEGVLAEGFVPFPKKLLRTLTSILGSTPEMEDLTVLLTFVDFKRTNQTRHPSIDYLSFISGLPEPIVEAALKRMESKGFLKFSIDEMDGYEIDHSQLVSQIESTASKTA